MSSSATPTPSSAAAEGASSITTDSGSGQLSSATSSAIAAASSSAAASSGTGPSSFYRNLFYILIGLLCAFGFVSFLSLMRARRRRAAVFAEADRLGLTVPGMPGYVPMRDREFLLMSGGDGSLLPSWWEVRAPPPHSIITPDLAVDYESEAAEGSDSMSELPSSDVLRPLAVLPPRESPAQPLPQPVSDIPYFPNHLAYRASTLEPPPLRFPPGNEAALDKLAGDEVSVVIGVRMPFYRPSRPIENPAPALSTESTESDEDVINEWGGLELGIVRFGVDNSKNEQNIPPRS